MRAPYTWLLFDADGTLFDYERAERVALRQALEQIGLAFEPAHLEAYRRINQDLWRALERSELKPEVLKVRRFELLFETLGIGHSAAGFSARYLDCLSACSELIDGAADVLLSLRNNYQFAIVTNGLTAVQRSRLARSVIRDHIAELIISEEIGCAKPAPEFFEATFARLGQPSKNEVLLIGDNWSSDIQGAVQYGIDACWFNPHRQPRPNGPNITREIASLYELENWLG
jgi:YjjG family noncanonical pyrimidine nucleotidase